MGIPSTPRTSSLEEPLGPSSSPSTAPSTSSPPSSAPPPLPPTPPSAGSATAFRRTPGVVFHNTSKSPFGGGTLHIKDLSLPEILVETERRGLPFEQLPTIPEQDDWIYADGKSVSCIAFILAMYKEAGLFDPIANSVQVAEFTANKGCMHIKVF